METATEICWSTKEPFKFLKRKSKSPQKDFKTAEPDSKPIKCLPYTGVCATATPKRRGTKQREKKQNSNTSLHSSSEIQPVTAAPLIRPPTPPKQSPIKTNTPQKPQDTVSPVCSNIDCVGPKPPKPKKLKKIKPVKKPPYPVSCSCPDNNVTEKKKIDKDDNRRSKPKYCTSCYTDRCECFNRSKRKKVKGKRTKTGASMSVLKDNAKNNCCACCSLLADYFKEVYRLITLKNDSRISQILCEMYDVAGCLCNDCLVFLKKVLGVIRGC